MSPEIIKRIAAGCFVCSYFFLLMSMFIMKDLNSFVRHCLIGDVCPDKGDVRLVYIISIFALISIIIFLSL